MTPVEFLRTVWPGDGVYCIAIKAQPKGFVHFTFNSINAAANKVDELLEERREIYFNVHVLKEHEILGVDKDGNEKKQYRTHANMRACKALFVDLDIGEGAGKYASQSEALGDLKTFCVATQLPLPTLVSSGGGFHCYWVFDEAIPTADWRNLAARFRQLADGHNLRYDPSRITDPSSLLRVVGTANFKQDTPRPVDLVGKVQAFHPASDYARMIELALVRLGEIPVAPKSPLDILGSNTDVEFTGPPVSGRALLEACALMQHVVATAATHSEPEWYHGVVGLVRFCDRGEEGVHKISSKHPDYSRANVQSKIDQHKSVTGADGRPIGPTSCERLSDIFGNDRCLTCPFHGKVRSPLAAARWKDKAPAPVVSLLPNAPVVTLPDAPAPFTRLKSGGIAVTAKDKDGNETNTQIYEYDIYPLRRLYDKVHEHETQEWRVELPRGETKDFTVPAEALYDKRRFVTDVCAKGLYPAPNYISALQEYMVAYIAQLQRQNDAEIQNGHLGWTEDRKNFILPDRVLQSDGTAKMSSLSMGAERSSSAVFTRGTLARQVELMRFYDGHKYLPNQFMILCGLGAPLFYSTGHYGVVVNASGDPGASKSTTLYAAASMWGHPKLYPINGTNNGATVKGRNERITVLANLPICVDEITHMPARDAIDLAMGVTQPGHRIRLSSDGVEKASPGSQKSTIMLTTANNSLHSVLAADNAAGTAGSMRVFEMRFSNPKVHTKGQADDFLFELEENFGHIGPALMSHIIKDPAAAAEKVRAWQRRIDKAANISSAERFYPATAATAFATAEIASELGLLGYSAERLFRWLVEEQIPEMRGVVVEEYSSPITVLADYLEHINADMIVTRAPHMVTQVMQDTGADVVREPRGSLLAHYDLELGNLWVLKKGFIDYCQRQGMNHIRVIDDLAKREHMGEGKFDAVILHKSIRRTLGAKTKFAKAQSHCFCVNMNHPSISGAVALTLVDGGKDVGSDTQAAATTA